MHRPLFPDLLLVTLGVWLLASSSLAEDRAPNPAEINVRAFGATGDGVTDDTDAIRGAMEAAAERVRHARWGKRGMRYSISPAVVFPAGEYRLTQTIEVQARVVRGDGEVTIVQHDDAADLFYFPRSWQVRVEGITFIGGRTQLSFGNPNMDRGQIVVANCRFYHSTGPAVVTREGTDSTFLNIRECVFSECRQAVISHSDWATLRDCWITSDPEMKDQAVIENYKVMTVDNLLGVPLGTHPGTRWIDNHDRVVIEGSRFGAEGGGFTPVYNFARFRNRGNGNFVVIQNSNVGAWANFRARCAVYCHEVPNSIVVRSSTLNVPPVILASHIDADTYFDNLADPGMLHYDVSSAIGEFIELPEMLRQPRTHPLRIEGQLGEQETQQAVAGAAGAIDTGRPEPTREAAFEPAAGDWRLDDLMDGTSLPNSEFLAKDSVAGRTVLVRRAPGKDNWPHATIGPLTVDLDRFPVLAVDLAETDRRGPFQTVVKLIDHESQTLYTVSRRNSRLQQRYDLRGLGLTGEREVSILLYYLGMEYVPATDGKPWFWNYAEAGDFLTVDRVAFVPGASGKEE